MNLSMTRESQMGCRGTSRAGARDPHMTRRGNSPGVPIAKAAWSSRLADPARSVAGHGGRAGGGRPAVLPLCACSSREVRPVRPAETPAAPARPALGLSIRSQCGRDWIFLILLGLLMATVSFGLDIVVSKCQQVNLWVYDELVDYRCLQYVSWTLYHVVLMVAAAAAAAYISPQAAGSGIPELQVALRGLVLPEFFTFRTLAAKLVGVVCTLAGGSTVFLGKVGPFVHMATILAMLLGKAVVTVAGSRENPGRKYDLLVAGAAVGVACCFVAPVGGVLFGVEATGTHFAVRNYWRGFFAATCAALAFRLLAVLNGAQETVAVLFRTSWRVEFPYDLPELLSFAVLGALCGGLCCVFLFCHRNFLLLLRTWPRVHRFVVNNKVFHAGLVSLLLASLTFPHGLGQYFGARLSMKGLLETFFNNATWGLAEASAGNATHRPPSPTLQDSRPQWTHPAVSSVEMVAFFLIAKFFMLLLATTMTVPAGYFLPVFVYGAGLGRLYGEVLARIFPAGLVSDGIRLHLTPAAYALAGAAAYSGAVTQTISTALLTFELTGQMSHILPVLLAVLVANAISRGWQPSLFEGLIRLKQLPVLPKLPVAGSGGRGVCVEDFMATDLPFLSRESRYRDLWALLRGSRLKQFPLVDSPASRILLGSVRRETLARLLNDQLSAEKRFQDKLGQWDKDPPGSSRGERPAAEASGEPQQPPSEAQGSPAEEAPEGEAEPGDAARPAPQEPRGPSCSLVEEWECRQLQRGVCLEELPVDPAPYRLVERETLPQCYELFSLLNLHTAYVTSLGRLVGVVTLRELRTAVEGCVAGTLPSRAPPCRREPSLDREVASAGTGSVDGSARV